MGHSGITYPAALNADTRKWLTGLLGADGVRFDEPMSGHTWFKVGGPAEAFASPESVDLIAAVVSESTSRGIPLTVVGGGTNLLVTDDGIPGIVLTLSRCLNRMAVTGTEGEKTIVTAMAGAKLPVLCRMAVERGLAGMNFAIGIPGSVGGAVMMNAGTAIGCMGDVVANATILTGAGDISVVAAEKIRFSYRRFAMKEKHFDEGASASPMILGVNISLTPSDPEALAKEASALLKARQEKQPLHLPSAGCFFRNPPEGGPAGMLIDKAGLKGTRIGDAEVSDLHANFIVNRGRATAADILRLAVLVENTVADKFGVALEREVRIVGC